VGITVQLASLPRNNLPKQIGIYDAARSWRDLFGMWIAIEAWRDGIFDVGSLEDLP